MGKGNMMGKWILQNVLAAVGTGVWLEEGWSVSKEDRGQFMGSMHYVRKRRILDTLHCRA